MKRLIDGALLGAGFMLVVAAVVAIAWAGDILTVDKDGTVKLRLTEDGAVGIPGIPDATALLDLSSTSKGFLMPRMTTTQRDTIVAPAVGLEVYNTTTNRAERYTGTSWKPVGISNVGARVYHGATQNIPNSTTSTLAFNSERYDTDAIHDTAVNNTRLTCKTAGKYHIYGTVQWANNPTGGRRVMLVVNGGTYVAIDTVASSPTDQTVQSVSTIYDLVTNDYVELLVTQWSGVSLNVEAFSSSSPEFGMTLLQE